MFDLGDETGLNAFLESAHTANTLTGYRRMVKKWLLFCELLLPGTQGGPVDSSLQLVTDHKARCVIWAKYIWFLRRREKLLPSAVNQHLSAAKYYLSTLMVGLSFTHDDTIVRRAKLAATKKSKDELRAELTRKQDTLKVPACDELTAAIYQRCWQETSFDTWDGVALKGVWICIAILDFFGHRPSNAAVTDAEHMVVARDVTMVYENPLTSALSYIPAGDPSCQDLDWTTVKQLQFSTLTAKRSSHATLQSVTMMDERSILLITCMAEWVTKSGVQLEDPLATYYRRSTQPHSNRRLFRRSTQVAELNAAIKNAADVIGIPRQHVSCRSYRQSLVSNDALAGISHEQTARTGGWAGPVVMQAHYNLAASLPNRAGLPVAPRVTLADIGMMLPKRSRKL